MATHCSPHGRQYATDLDRDRSNVNRSLTRLNKAGLVCRQRRLLDGGDYVYAYFAEPGEVVMDRLSEALDQWPTAASSTIKTHQWDDGIVHSG